MPTTPLQNGERAEAVAQQGKAASRLGALLLLLRLAALCFSVAAAAFAATDGTALRRAPFRFLLAADAIVAVYSAFEAGAAAWEVVRGSTLLPEALQLWFDFGHDQGFGYMALAAAAAAARDAGACGGGGDWRSGGGASCVQAHVAVGLGFAGFASLALAALVTGFRLACFLATGSRFVPPPSSTMY
ncbi:CASP-like protein 4C1 [Phragmites australis]|uniref:CASP-like protein 4C1 n=1 Tax=Phragmites australis TaxID=29695 RepID=UPI002D7930AB|nr:CASP-like protein 4C1 [Phragmites australis]